MSAQVEKLEALLRRVETNKNKPRALRAAPGIESAPAAAAPSSAPSSAAAPAPAASAPSGRSRRRRLSTPLEQVIEDASATRTGGEEAVTTPGTRRAPAGPPINDLASPVEAAMPAAQAKPAAKPTAQAKPAAAPAAAPVEAAAVRAASVAPPSAPIATAVPGEGIDTSAATFGAMFARSLKLRPR